VKKKCEIIFLYKLINDKDDNILHLINILKESISDQNVLKEITSKIQDKFFEEQNYKISKTP